jgi:hypothetical protein
MRTAETAESADRSDRKTPDPRLSPKNWTQGAIEMFDGSSGRHHFESIPDCDLPTAMTVCELSELLFCSTLQPSQVIDPETVAAALAQSLRSHAGQLRTCAAELAGSYGKDPESTCSRMRWALDLIAATFPRAG